MSADRITFRLDPRVRACIQELVAEGEYLNISDFVNRAILFTFAFQRIPVGGMALVYDPLGEYFASYCGRRLLRDVVRGVLGG